MKISTIKVAAPLVVAALFLSGCGPTAEPEPEAPEASGTLRASWGGFPENWAPGQDIESGYLRVPYEMLVGTNAAGELEGVLATEWEQTDTDVTFTLRDGVLFHDGTEFNAEAVAANVDVWKESPLGGPLGVIESVDVVDDLTVKLNLSEPTPTIVRTLATRVAAVGSPAAIADGSIAQAPVGTGPWAYDAEASIAGVRMAFPQFAEYWGEPVGFANIELLGIEDDEAAAAALVSGEVDLIDGELRTAGRFEGEPVELLFYPAIRNNVTFFDRGPGGVFESVELRQAFCHVMDPNVVVQVDGEGEAATQHFAEGEQGYNPEIGYEIDLARAQELYAAAGSPSINVEMVAAPFNAGQIQIYMDQASEIGDINVTVNTLPPPEFFQQWNSGRFPLGLAGNDEATPFEWYRAYFAADAPANPAGVESAELKAAADAAIAAGLGEEADALWAEVTKIISEEALTCSHLRGEEILAFNTEVVSGVERPLQPWETNSVNYRALVPVG
jgi:ABC-type transport system substrate-binding protein